jgi:hypothetical protein
MPARRPRGLMRKLPLIVGVLLTFLMLGAPSAMAETGKKALVLDSSVSGGAGSSEATRAASLGFTVTVVDDATWGAMTATQFSDYQLIIVGDPTCSSLPAVVSENAQALSDAVMDRVGSNTHAGNRILIGTDPQFHNGQGGGELIDAGIDFAGVQEGASGLYLTFTCVDPDYDGNGVPDGQDLLLPKLTIDATPGWTQNQGPPCGGEVSLISNADQFSSLTTSDIAGWGCSVHETFPTFPSDWNPLAIATDTPTAPTCGTDVETGDPECGEAYLLIAGTGIVSEAPNLELTPLTATNPVGTTHTVTAKVTNSGGTPRSGVTVTFTVTGANAGASGTCAPASCTTPANGQVTFTYTGTNPGDDTINASITVDGSTQTATAAKTWVAAPAGKKGRMTSEGRLTGNGKTLDFANIIDCTKANNASPKFAGSLSGQAFSVTTVTTVTCTDQPGVTPSTAATFDTQDGTGTGKVGATNVTVEWQFVDGGLASSGDTTHIVIRNAATNAIIIDGSGAPPGPYGGGTRLGRNTASPPA